ncbi:hypothetical protein BSPWISOXPB_5594 [uncultured Gammaproteobacteria bacterium]|nr:hypothetical protein BSPWISOXPB_5594 [uncultured Gammaproteobacteria bacterium]
MKIIKLLVVYILLLSSFQTFALKDPERFKPFHITTADVSTPENREKVIKLTTNKDTQANPIITFAIVDGLDSKKFTLVGDKLTFEATDFEARKNATYHVKIRSTFSIPPIWALT